MIVVPLGPGQVGVLNVIVGMPVYVVVSVTEIMKGTDEFCPASVMADGGPGM